MERETTIEQLFSNRKIRFEIPSYQRAYSWEEKQLKQFVEDLRNVKKDYYFGNFLFEQKDKYTYLVIDGQQRLTTIIIFFSALHDFLNQYEEEELLDDIKDTYFIDLSTKKNKFSTVSYDNSFFQYYIIERGKENLYKEDTSSSTRIKTAKDFFLKIFQNEKEIRILKSWKNVIEDAVITTYEVPGKTRATQIFSFQNDRGKALTKLEIIKAYFMLQVYQEADSEEDALDSITALEKEFEKIYQVIELMEIPEDEVLRIYWRVFSNYGFNSEDVIEEIKEVLKTQKRKAEWIKNNVSKLKRTFELILEIKENKANIQAVTDLFYLKNTAFSLPFLIKAKFLNFSEGNYIRLARLLENITFRTLIRGGRAVIQSRLHWQLLAIDEKKDAIIDIIKEQINNNDWWKFWNDDELERHLNGYFYQNRVDNYLLWKYELSLPSYDYGSPLDYKSIIAKENIEHIAPQTPTKGEVLENGYGHYKDIENPNEGILSGGWLNKLGNLMIISKQHNCSIGNKPFKIKLDSYNKSGTLQQHKRISAYVDVEQPIWNKSAIEKRHHDLIKFALDKWDISKI